MQALDPIAKARGLCANSGQYRSAGFPTDQVLVSSVHYCSGAALNIKAAGLAVLASGD